MDEPTRARIARVRTQDQFAVRFEWGQEGARELAPDVDAVVIVDVLSFTTCVDLATARDAVVFPYRFRDASARDFASKQQALLAGENERGYTLRPASLEQIEHGTRLVLPSPNGSTLSQLTGGTPTLAGCLRNASAVAARASSYGSRVAVIAAGERWPEDTLRPSLEDLCGAGAVLAALRDTHPSEGWSPEAVSAVVVFESVRDRLHDCIAACISGREKLVRDMARDVELAAACDVSDCAPVLVEGAYRRAA